MDEWIETNIERIVGNDHCCVSTGEKKFIKQLKELAQKKKDEVIIIAENNDGSITAHVPYNWFKFVAPPQKRNLTEAQREALKERMKKARESKN